jgi:hypothetical protein
MTYKTAIFTTVDTSNRMYCHWTLCKYDIWPTQWFLSSFIPIFMQSQIIRSFFFCFWDQWQQLCRPRIPTNRPTIRNTICPVQKQRRHIIFVCSTLLRQEPGQCSWYSNWAIAWAIRGSNSERVMKFFPSRKKSPDRIYDQAVGIENLSQGKSTEV